MNYYLNVFSPETYEAFSKSTRTISGFQIRHKTAAQKVKPGDRLLCYMTRIMRWVGVLEVESEFFVDESPIFAAEDDPYVLRFKAKPLAWLDKDKTVPIHEDRVWNTLSYTRVHPKTSSQWTGIMRNSLNQLSQTDGAFLEQLVVEQANGGRDYPMSEKEYRKHFSHRVRGVDKVISVSVPEDTNDEKLGEPAPADEIRESLKIQALLADIGIAMGLKIWIPNNDRSRVRELMRRQDTELIKDLPLGYDAATTKTIQQIDVIWLKQRSIIRAFEVEHTTSIYSGILRMADLLALQPNMAINLHIVAPLSRKDKVLTEIRRPIFSLIEEAPLAEKCTYLSYDSIRELSQQTHLEHTLPTVLDNYAESAEE